MTKVLTMIPWPFLRPIFCEHCRTLYRLEKSDTQLESYDDFYEGDLTLEPNTWRYISQYEYQFISMCPTCGCIIEEYKFEKPADKLKHYE